MEHNGKFYFGYPLPAWTGKVYEVDPAAVGAGSIVRLPNGTELQLVVDGGVVLRVTETSSQDHNDAPIFEATEVFDTFADNPLFEGDWDRLLWQLNAAAAVNALFVVRLTRDEYERLAADGCLEFEKLKGQMSLRAASLVNLLESNYVGGKGPALFLYRIGRCP